MKNQWRNWGLWLAVLLIATTNCLAQGDTARLQGTITDASGAAVASVTVTVTSVETGKVSSATTNDLGYYTVTALPAGHYRVDLEQKGFKKVSRTLELQVAQIGVSDFQLQVGDVAQVINVEAGSPVINLQDSAMGSVIEAKQIEEIPLNGRNFTQLALLIPGVTRGQPNGVASGASNNAETFRFGQEGGAALAVNGIRPQADNFILDGIDNNEALVNTIVLFPPADAIQEFRVQTSIAPAEYGRAGGALVITNIKSGTNDYHGSAFWFNRNTALNAEDFFTTPNTPTPGFNRNQFGGTAGGPILKNKLFIFGDYQGLRQQIPSGPEYATVPTDLMRQGNFSELLLPASVTGLSRTYPIYNPTTDGSVAASPADPNGALAFNGNVIPTGQINTVGQAYLNAYPEPNCSQSVDPACFSVYHNYKNTRKLIENWNDFDIRGDYLVNSTNSLFVRYSRGHADQTDTTRLTTLPSGFGSGTNFNHPSGASVGLVSTLSPTLVNEFRGGFVRTVFGYFPPSNNQDLCIQLGIVNCNTPLLGGIALIGGYNNQIEYTGDYGTYEIPQTGFNYNDTLSWIKGRHTIKIGGTILRRELNLYRPLSGKGYFQLAGDGTSGCCSGATGHVDTGYEVSDLLAGFVDGYSHGTPFGMVGTRSWENGFFGQDDFRVTNRLTLNLGLRWDILTWPTEVENRQANFDLVTGALVVAGSNGAPRTLIPNDYHNFGPRAGFAYQLTKDGKTVVRGGYGLFYFIDRGGISSQLAQNPPFSGQNSVTYQQGYRITLSGALACEPNCTAAQLIAANATGSLPSGSFVGLNLAAPTGVSVNALLPSNITPMVSQYNLQIQRQIGNDQSVSISYVGTHGAHLVRNYNANQQLYDAAPGPGLYPNLGSITVQDTSGKSDYNAMQIQYQRHVSKGLQVTGAFTWSKTLDDSCGNLDTGTCSPQLYTNYSIERGLSTQDQDYATVISALYELPFGRKKQFAGNIPLWADYLVGGWQLNGIYTLDGGTPFNITVSGNPSSTRADLVGKIQVSPGNINDYVNASAFAAPATNGQGIFIAPGTAGRNIVRGPGFSNMDLALFKNFPVTERVKGQFRVQAYNLTNTPHFANPADTNLSDGHIGLINSVLTNSWRQLELGLRFTF